MSGWLLLLTVRANAVECVANLDRDAFEGRLDAAEQAWLDLDTTTFRADMNDLAGLVVPCMGDLVPAQLSARWHRLMALHFDDLGDAARADASIVAARTLDPSLALDDRWVGADHHLRAAWDAAAPGGTRKVPEPRTGSLAFDGTLGRLRPDRVPSLVQVFDESGTARSTVYLGADDPLPPYDAVPRTRNALLVASVGSVVLAGISYGMASAAQSRLFTLADDPTTSADALRAQRTQADLLTVGATVFVGAAAGTGAGAVLVGRR